MRCPPRTSGCSRRISRAGPLTDAGTLPGPGPSGPLAHQVGGGRRPIGVALASIGVTPGWWLDAARRLEAAGYAGVWVWDHHATRGRPNDVLESWTMLTAAATATSRIAVGSHVLNVMNRHPSLLARMAATLQQLSGGRLVLGLGIGGNPADGRPFGFPDPDIPERTARLEEAVAVIRALWTGETIVRPSPFYPLAGGRALPAPGPPPPIVIGGQSSAGARLAARIADGWTTRPDLLDRLAPAFAEALDVAGRDRQAVSVLVGWEGGRAGQDALRASPWIDAPRETLAEWQARGADGIVLAARTDADVDALVGAAERW